VYIKAFKSERFKTTVKSKTILKNKTQPETGEKPSSSGCKRKTHNDLFRTNK
jgi:hypothetical protein